MHNNIGPKGAKMEQIKSIQEEDKNINLLTRKLTSVYQCQRQLYDKSSSPRCDMQDDWHKMAKQLSKINDKSEHKEKKPESPPDFSRTPTSKVEQGGNHITIGQPHVIVPLILPFKILKFKLC